MENHEQPEIPTHPVYEKQKLSIWRRVGGGSLGISLMIHAAVLAVGVYLVVQVIPKEKEPLPPIAPTGSPGKPQASVKPPSSIPQAAIPRIVKEGQSTITLPDQPASNDMNSLNPLSGGSLDGPQGAGGPFPGSGPEGLAIGGPETGKSPFGIADARADGITGVFYDLKQTKNGKPTGLDDPQVREVVREFVTKGWKDQVFSSFYQAPERLKQTRVFIPMMEASKAPEAFNCEKEVKPSKWVVVYRGNVVAPKSGKFRFVGGGDDVLAIRFNGQPVFDYGYTIAHFGIRVPHVREMDEKDFKKEARKNHFPMPYPIQVRSYPNIGHFSNPKELAGIATGADFEVEANATYPIEILISEIPGGKFSSLLFIEEVGATYTRLGDVSVLPIFRMNASLPADGKDLPPYDKNSPIWQSRPSAGTID